MSAAHTATGTPRCRAYIEPRDGERSCPQCSRPATHVLPGTDRVWCGQHARRYDVPLPDDERERLTRSVIAERGRTFAAAGGMKDADR